MMNRCSINGHSSVRDVNIVHIKPSEAQIQGIYFYPQIHIRASAERKVGEAPIGEDRPLEFSNTKISVKCLDTLH